MPIPPTLFILFAMCIPFANRKLEPEKPFFAALTHLLYDLVFFLRYQGKPFQYTMCKQG